MYINLLHNKNMCEFITVTFDVILPNLIKRPQPRVALLVKIFSAFCGAWRPATVLKATQLL
jgi:hypothetical protein